MGGGGGRLRVTVIEGRNLARKDVFSKSDPYCILSIHSKMDLSMFEHKQETTVINNNQNPCWNQTFYLNVRNAQTDLLKVRVFDKDMIRDDLIGEVDIPLFNLMPGQPKEEWLQLSPANGGSIHLVVVAEGFGAQGGYGGVPQAGGYPQAGGGYPQAGYGGGYPQQQGFGQQQFPQGGFPLQQGFPQQGYPVQQGFGQQQFPQGGFPPQGGYY